MRLARKALVSTPAHNTLVPMASSSNHDVTVSGSCLFTSTRELKYARAKRSRPRAAFLRDGDRGSPLSLGRLFQTRLRRNPRARPTCPRPGGRGPGGRRRSQAAELRRARALAPHNQQVLDCIKKNVRGTTLEGTHGPWPGEEGLPARARRGGRLAISCKTKPVRICRPDKARTSLAGRTVQEGSKWRASQPWLRF